MLVLGLKLLGRLRGELDILAPKEGGRYGSQVAGLQVAGQKQRPVICKAWVSRL